MFGRVILLVAIAVSSIGMAADAARAETPPTKPFVITSTRIDDQHMSDGFCFKNGRCVLVFRSGRYGSGDIRIRRFDAQGRPSGRDIQVQKPFGGAYGDHVAVHPYGADKFAVSRVEYRDYYKSGMNLSTYRLSKTGKLERISSVFKDLVDNYTLDDNGDLAVQGKGFLSVYPDFTAPGAKIYAQKHDRKGKAVGKRYRVNQAAFGGDDATIRRLSTGGYAVAWQSGESIRMRILNASGKPVGPERSIVLPLYNYVSRPVLEAMSGGRFAVFFANDKVDAGLHYHIYNKSGKFLRRGTISSEVNGPGVPYNSFGVVRKMSGGFAFVYRVSLGHPNWAMNYQEYDRELRPVRGETQILVQTSNEIDEFDAISVIQSAPKRGLVSWTTDPSGTADGFGRALVGISVPFK